MGLYDSYRYSSRPSTRVPVYQGGVSGELSKLGSVMGAQYEAAQNAVGAIGDLITQVPVREQDKETLKGLYGEVSSKLDSWAARGDYENLLGEVSRYGRPVKNRVGILVQQKQMEDAYVKQQQESGNSPEAISTAIAMARANSTPIEFTPDGRHTGGFAGGMDLMKPVDVNKKIIDAVKILNPSLGDKEVKVDKGQVSYLDKDTWKTISPSQVKSAMDAMMKNDQELKNWINQNATLKGYSYAANHTDQSINDFLKSDKADPTFKKQVQDYIDAGKSKKEAVASVMANLSQRDQQASILQFALGASYTEETHKNTREPGEFAKIDHAQALEYDYWKRKEVIKQANETKEDPTIVTPGTALHYTEFSTYKDLAEKGIKPLEDSITDTQEKVKVKTRQIKELEGKTDDKSRRAKALLESDLEELTTSLKGNQEKLQSYKTLESNALLKAAQAKYGTTYEKEIGNTTIEVKAQMEKEGLFKNGTVGEGTNGKKYKITQEQLAKAISEGKVRQLQGWDKPVNGEWKHPEGLRGIFSSGSYQTEGAVVTIDGREYAIRETPGKNGKASPLYDFFEKTSIGTAARTQAIRSDALKLQTKDFSLAENFSTIPDKIKAPIQNSLAGAKYLGRDGKETILPKNVNMSKSEVTRASVDGTGHVEVRLQSMPTKDHPSGEDLGVHYFDLGTSNLNQVLGRKNLGNADENVRQLGKEQMSEVFKRYPMMKLPGAELSATQNGDPLVVNTGSEKPTRVTVHVKENSYYLTDENGTIISLGKEGRKNHPINTLPEFLLSNETYHSKDDKK